MMGSRMVKYGRMAAILAGEHYFAFNAQRESTRKDKRMIPDVELDVPPQRLDLTEAFTPPFNPILTIPYF